jgi:hypothetical protein
MEKKLNAGNDLIDRLLLKHRISLRTVSDFADKHMGELMRAEKIFELKEEGDQKLCLAIFRLLSEKQAEAISASFCSLCHIADSSTDELFFERNRLFLLSAFIYNPSFFAMSWNLCGIMRSHLTAQAESSIDGQEQKNGAARLIPFQRTMHVLAASSADEALREIWSETVYLDGISGRLRILANDKDDAGLMQFRFRFSAYHPEPPFYLRVFYTTNSDSGEHVVELSTVAVNNSGKGELVIASELQRGIRYSEGFVITAMERLRHD